MSLFGESFLNVSITVGFGVLSLSLVMTFVRLVRGPSLPDRVVALDLTAFIAVAFTALYSIATRQQVFLDAATALALIAFLSTLAFARFVGQQSVGQQSVGRQSRGES